MPVTLAQAALNATSDIDVSVINEFRSSPLLDLVTFDDVVNPAGGGATLTYGYTRQITAPTAAFRAINSEYTPTEVTKQRFTVDLKPLGGSFQIDRVLAKVGPAASNDVSLQMTEKIRAAQGTFANAVINGDTGVDANSFDGLSKMLTGTSTETTTTYDVSGTRDMTWAFKVLDAVDALLSMLDGDASAIIGNTRAIAAVRAAMRMTSQYVIKPGAVVSNGISGGAVGQYGDGGPILFDAGKRIDGSTDVVRYSATDPDGASPLVAGSTDLYAVRMGLDGFHGVSIAGGQLVWTALPDFTTAGAVKTGEVELGPVAMVLKRTRAAAVLRNFKVS